MRKRKLRRRDLIIPPHKAPHNPCPRPQNTVGSFWSEGHRASSVVGGRPKPMLQRSHRSLPFQLSRPGVLDPEPHLEMATFIGFEVGWNGSLGQVTIRLRAVKQSSCVPQLLSGSHQRASSLQSAASKPAERTRYEDFCPLPGFVCQGPGWSFWLWPS